MKSMDFIKVEPMDQSLVRSGPDGTPLAFENELVKHEHELVKHEHKHKFKDFLLNLTGSPHIKFEASKSHWPPHRRFEASKSHWIAPQKV